MKKSNFLAIMILLLCVFGCKTISEFGGKKSDSSSVNSSSNGKTIEGFENYWQFKKGNNLGLMSFINGRFNFVEDKESPTIKGTYKVVADDEVEVEIPDKPTLKITNIKIKDKTMTMKINGRDETMWEMGSR
ncbi:hypothetical protein BH10ACI1_BH10ACI1_31790 [soil metagenome]